MVRDSQADDGSIYGVDVREIAFHATRMREREFGVHCRVEMLFGKQPPVGDEAVVFLSRQLGTPGSIVESFVSTEEQCRDGAAEPERIAPVVRRDEATVNSDANLAPAIGAIECQFSIR